jgi:hypothetical protein
MVIIIYLFYSFEGPWKEESEDIVVVIIISFLIDY